ncbi:MAG: class I SAM-dependent methyltransferase [Conexivisphaerales archaeon]
MPEKQNFTDQTRLAASQLKELSKSIFSSLYPNYDRVVMYFTFFHDRKWKAYLLNRAKLKRGSMVLDIGIGTGILEDIVAAKSSPEFVGIDMSADMLKECMKKKISKVSDLIQADAEHLPFRNSSFGAVLSCYVVKYCRASEFVSQAFAVLKPGGILAFYDFARPMRRISLHYVYVCFILPLLGRISARTVKWISPTMKELPKVIMNSEWEATIRLFLRSSGFDTTVNELLSSKGARLVVAKKEAAMQQPHRF